MTIDEKHKKHVKSYDILALNLPPFFYFLYRIHTEASLEASKTSILPDEGKDLLGLDFQKSYFFDVRF